MGEKGLPSLSFINLSLHPKQVNNTPTDISESPDGSAHVALQIAFSVVCVWTITSSLMVCAVNLKNRDMLKNPYNINILHLALADLLTALMIAVTPGFITDTILPVPVGTLGSELHCRLVESHFFVFTFSSVSIYVTLALAIERWYAVVKPLRYRTAFHCKRLILEAVCIWVCAAAFNGLTLLFELKFDQEKPPSERCNITPHFFFFPIVRKLIAVVMIAGKFLIPLTVTAILYGIIFREAGKSRVLSRSERTRHSLSRMGAASTLALALSWFPNQVYYASYNFGVVELNTGVHYWTIVIAMLNSCLNPLIFAFHSVQYREGFKQLLTCNSLQNYSRKNVQFTSSYQLFKASQIFLSATGIKAPRSIEAPIIMNHWVPR